jgi:hypothetical protein
LKPAVYDVTRSETFESLENIWLNEWEMYSTVDSAVKMVVGNKVDLVMAWLVVMFFVAAMVCTRCKGISVEIGSHSMWSNEGGHSFTPHIEFWVWILVMNLAG